MLLRCIDKLVPILEIWCFDIVTAPQHPRGAVRAPYGQTPRGRCPGGRRGALVLRVLAGPIGPQEAMTRFRSMRQAITWPNTACPSETCCAVMTSAESHPI